MSIIYYSLFILLLLSACRPSVPLEELNASSDATLVIPPSAIDSALRAKENKIANRTLWQKVVDESTTWGRKKIRFACNNSQGGLLTLVQDQDGLKGLRLAYSEEQQQLYLGYYYKNNELVFAVHERSTWRGSAETDIQTVFYIDGGEVFHCLQREVAGETHQMESRIQATALAEIPKDEAVWEVLKSYEKKLKTNAKIAHLQAVFCEK